MTNQEFRTQAKALAADFDQEKARSLLLSYWIAHPRGMLHTEWRDFLEELEMMDPQGLLDELTTLLEGRLLRKVGGDLQLIAIPHELSFVGLEVGDDREGNICIVTDKPITISSVNGVTCICVTMQES